MRHVTAIALFFAPASALAQTVCPENEIELYPFDRSEDVPRNGVVRVVYRDPTLAPAVTGGAAERVIEVFCTGDPDVEEDPCNQVEGDGRLAGSATLQNSATGDGREAIWRSEGLLPAGAALTATFQDAFGTPIEFHFTTGDSVDEIPPEFEGASATDIVESDGGSLTDDGYRVRVTLPQPQDESGSGNVELIVYQTDGPDWAMPIERARVRCVTTGTGMAAFVVPHAEVGRWACFQARAVDMFGRTEENDAEACGIPEGPGHFRSICSAAGPGVGAGSISCFLFPVSCLLLFFRSNRRQETGNRRQETGARPASP